MDISIFVLFSSKNVELFYERENRSKPLPLLIIFKVQHNLAYRLGHKWTDPELELLKFGNFLNKSSGS